MNDFALFLPELYLAVTAIGLVLGDVGYHGERTRVILPTALCGIGGAAVQLLVNYAFGAGRYGHANFANDGFGLFLKAVLLAAAGIGLVFDRKSHEVSLESRTEHAALLLGVTALGMLAVSSVNWVWTLLLLFSVQLLGALIFSMKKTDVRATEAAFKGALAAIHSLFLLALGVLVFYAATGEFDLYRIHAAIAAGGIPARAYAVGFACILAGLGFFGSYFPSQLWAKDAFEGASLPATAFASTLFRTTAIGVLVRVVIVQFAKESGIPGVWEPISAVDWTPVLSLVAGATLAMSALYVFRQTETRKLFAGVLVFQSGFYLLGLLALDQVGLASILFGLATEVFMVGGLFSGLAYFEDRSRDAGARVSFTRSIPEGVGLLLFIVCVIGLPPLPGFIAKFALISSAARHQWNGLVAIAFLALVLVAISVFRWIYPAVHELRQKHENLELSWTHRALVLGLLLPLVLLSVFAEPMLEWVGRSVDLPIW